MPENLSIEVMRLAVLTNIFPLYEVEDGEVYRQTVLPDEVYPINTYTKLQGRFRHLTEQDLDEYQKAVDKYAYLKGSLKRQKSPQLNSILPHFMEGLHFN